jgi:hypothetical protein
MNWNYQQHESQSPPHEKDSELQAHFVWNNVTENRTLLALEWGLTIGKSLWGEQDSFEVIWTDPVEMTTSASHHQCPSLHHLQHQKQDETLLLLQPTFEVVLFHSLR